MKPFIIILIVFFVVRYLRKRIQTPGGAGGHPGDKDDKGASRGRREHDVKSSGRGERRSTSQEEEMVFDPVCRTYVPLNIALRVDMDGSTEYFCSSECRERFTSPGHRH